MIGLPLSKSEKSRRHNLRTRARKRIRLLVERQEGKCYWCKFPISVDAPKRLVQGRKRRLQVRPATIDHIKRLADGGDNRMDNLVAACQQCNNQRTKQPRKTSTCKFCDSPRPRKGRTCKACKRQLLFDFLGSHGFDFWPDGAGGTWQCLETGCFFSTTQACEIAKGSLDKPVWERVSSGNQGRPA